MIIRGAALFYPVEGGRVNEDRLSVFLDRFVESARRISRRYGIEFRTMRVSLPFLEPDWDVENIISSVSRVTRRLGLINASINVTPEVHFSFDRLLDLFVNSESYMTIWAGDRRFLEARAVNLYKYMLFRLVELNKWGEARRIGVLLGDPIQTPYYPTSINLTNTLGLSISLLYVDDLIKAGLSGAEVTMRELFRSAEEIGRELSDELNVDYMGLDVSLSPWGHDSVVKLVESFFGIRFGEPGTLSVLSRLNRLIWSSIGTVRVTGFNEIMLPVAEDELLKERVREGLVNTPKLVKYTVACVAGVDMVVFPFSQLDSVAGIIEDIQYIVSVKRRTLGVRLIPYSGESREARINGFGDTPIMGLS